MKSLQQAYLDLSIRLPISDKGVSDRLERGKGILQSKGYSVKQINDTEYDVYRESTSLLEDNAVHYTVSTAHCTCPDYDSARANLCKHRLAIMLKIEMEND